MKINISKKHLSIKLEKTSNILSWCVHNGGQRKGRNIFWAQVSPNDLTPTIEPLEHLQGMWENEAEKPDVAFMTSAYISDFVHKKNIHQDLEVEVLTTVGMGNALKVGDPGGFHLSLGTINILVEINRPISESAMIEAICIATEAKTTAVIESGIRSIISGKISSGTGTDCIGIAAAEKQQNQNEYIYSGKHTKLGELIGLATYEAVTLGINKWKIKNREKREVNNSYWGS